ncbi:hypothetical protein [Runella aurantiaca]|uniref:Uncharacterized protein n=1 Tax=Runella aurantiaca TaxID=2282308 RepID=A0A369I9N3_9BACT|nr:hypothetical protein [Runella aurantiaca]RDB05590.1 hypothetical protein DVG78_13490 [Runella aurantiaca]
MERQPTDRSSRIMRLIELIEQINGTLQIHRNDCAADRPEPDAFVIEQYEYRRSQYLGELAVLMQPLGVEIQWKNQNAA